MPAERYTVLDLARKRSTAMTTVRPPVLGVVSSHPSEKNDYHSHALMATCHVGRFTLSVCYYALSLNTSQLHSYPYNSCFLSAVVEVPAYMSSGLAIRYFPRCFGVMAVFLTIGLVLFSIQLVPKSEWDTKAKELSSKPVGAPGSPIFCQGIVQKQ
ncbi:solute carrier family 22 member 4-like [Phyllopteryx taeniolatus]|uniref:solute carrier family 22 member 4-like n=1 Tax=Phyllopteryx taeniolatus TaxID=161469 RepID=UPI002AD45B0A|nr:solute carrier family 22 member 4-like [Phyllopteryx taeniolatus]